jgi:glutathione S-transferase
MSDDATITLHWGSGSPYAWRAQLALELKRVPYASRLIEFSKGEHRTEAFRRLNPRGKVPVLVDGDFVVYESLAILSYLDQRFPEPPLLGTTAAEHGRIWQRVFELDNYVLRTASSVVNPLFSGKADRETLEGAMTSAWAELERVAGWLDAGPWLAGERVSAVDVVAYPGIQTLERAFGKPIASELGVGLPDTRWWNELTAWRDRFAALPGVENTYPPHWR